MTVANTQKRQKRGHGSIDDHQIPAVSTSNAQLDIYNKIVKYFITSDTSLSNINNDLFLEMIGGLDYNDGVGSRDSLIKAIDLYSTLVDEDLAITLIEKCNSFNLIFDLWRPDEQKHIWYLTGMVSYIDIQTLQPCKRLFAIEEVESDAHTGPHLAKFILRRLLVLDNIYASYKKNQDFIPLYRKLFNLSSDTSIDVSSLAVRLNRLICYMEVFKLLKSKKNQMYLKLLDKYQIEDIFDYKDFPISLDEGISNDNDFDFDHGDEKLYIEGGIRYSEPKTRKRILIEQTEKKLDDLLKLFAEQKPELMYSNDHETELIQTIKFLIDKKVTLYFVESQTFMSDTLSMILGEDDKALGKVRAKYMGMFYDHFASLGLVFDPEIFESGNDINSDMYIHSSRIFSFKEVMNLIDGVLFKCPNVVKSTTDVVKHLMMKSIDPLFNIIKDTEINTNLTYLKVMNAKNYYLDDFIIKGIPDDEKFNYDETPISHEAAKLREIRTEERLYHNKVRMGQERKEINRELSNLSNIIQKFRNIINLAMGNDDPNIKKSWFIKEVKEKFKYLDLDPLNELKLDLPNRWDSTMEMLKTCYKYKAVFDWLTEHQVEREFNYREYKATNPDDPDYLKSRNQNQTEGDIRFEIIESENIKKIRINPYEWNLIYEYLDILYPFKIMFDELFELPKQKEGSTVIWNGLTLLSLLEKLLYSQGNVNIESEVGTFIQILELFKKNIQQASWILRGSKIDIKPDSSISWSSILNPKYKLTFLKFVFKEESEYLFERYKAKTVQDFYNSKVHSSEMYQNFLDSLNKSLKLRLKKHQDYSFSFEDFKTNDWIQFMTGKNTNEFESSYVRDILEIVLNANGKTINKTKARKEFLTYIKKKLDSELDEYLYLKTPDTLNNEDPFEFWKDDNNRKRFPILSFQAFLIFDLPLGSLDIDEIFDVSTKVYEKRRDSISSDTMSNIINLKLFYSRNTEDAQERVQKRFNECFMKDGYSNAFNTAQ